MKQHSQRSKRPPLRTLAPRILAALAAGAVTLGALPYAYADPIVASSVTSDMVTEDGVAGSIDGSSATITVGRTGGGDTPNIGVKDTHGNFDQWRNVVGAYRVIPLANANIHLSNSKAIVRSGKLKGAYGAVAWAIGGTALVEDNTVEVSGGVFTGTDGSAVAGGLARVEDSGPQAVAVARRNHATITGGSFDGRYLQGGYAFIDDSGTIFADATAEGNTLTITGGSFLEGRTKFIYTGDVTINKHGGAAGRALRNHLTINTDMSQDSFMAAGMAFAELNANVNLQANENVANVRTSGEEIYGGSAVAWQVEHTSPTLGTVEAHRNKVWIAAGSGTFDRKSAAGYSELKASNTTTLRAAANENEFSIEGGNFDNIWGGGALGGGSSIKSERTGADTFAAATANKNKLWVGTHAGWFNADLIGGSAKVQATAGRAEAAAHENELYVKGGTYQQNVYSGSAEAASENGSAVAQATKNYLSTETNVTPDLMGGHASAEAKGTFDVLASENLLSLRGGARSFIGGYAEGTQQDSGTYVLQSTGTANENSMEIRSTGTFTDKSAGGYVHITANNTKLLSAAAAKNEVLLQDGTFNEDVAGGRSFARNTTTAADSVTNAAANENTVHALGGTYGAGLYGGSAYAEAKREFNASANKNKLAVSAGAKNFIGGYAEGKQLAPGESVQRRTRTRSGWVQAQGHSPTRARQATVRSRRTMSLNQKPRQTATSSPSVPARSVRT